MKRKQQATASGEDYLEAILVIQMQKGAVRSVDIARHIDYSGPLAHPGRSLAQLDRASAHSTRSAVQPMLAADQHTC